MANIKEFRPSRHGFPFINSFPLADLAEAFQAKSLGVDVAPFSSSYGLCGGMSSAAADYYTNEIPIPAESDIPEPGSALFRYLLNRQVTTFGTKGMFIARFLTWMRLSDSVVKVLTVNELEAILKKLDRNSFVVLGLVHVGLQGTPWENHQVLTYGYEKIDDTTIRLKIYEPNAPLADDAYIEVTYINLKLNRETLAGLRSVSALSGSLRKILLQIPSFFPDFLLPTLKAVNCRKHRGNPLPVRGFFQMPYEPQQP